MPVKSVKQGFAGILNFLVKLDLVKLKTVLPPGFHVVQGAVGLLVQGGKAAAVPGRQGDAHAGGEMAAVCAAAVLDVQGSHEALGLFPGAFG